MRGKRKVSAKKALAFAQKLGIGQQDPTEDWHVSALYPHLSWHLMNKYYVFIHEAHEEE